MRPDDLAKSGSEHGEQRAFFGYLAIAIMHGFGAADHWANGGDLPETVLPLSTHDKSPLSFIFAIPNGGKRDKITAGKLKAEGVKPGVPDIFVPITTPQFAGMFIEMKRTKSAGKAKGVVAKDTQTPYHSYLVAAPYAVAVCYTWREAVTALQTYLNGEWNNDRRT